MSSLVFPYRAKVKHIPEEYNYYPFEQGDIVCVIGELVGMPGHYVVVLPSGKTVFGYHDDFFEPIDLPNTYKIIKKYKLHNNSLRSLSLFQYYTNKGE